jgi:phage/plasmid-associated DNA primase
VGRAGQPDRRFDQFEPTLLHQQLVRYQYVWGGDTSKGEWTTTMTFSATTNNVIRIDRDRK